MTYDAIVVGARVAGSATAMLLARRGARVLLVDRVRFPADTMNGHFIVAAGVKALERWGLRERVQHEPGACPPVDQYILDFGSVTLHGHPTWPDGTPAVSLAPRRSRIDTLLGDAAAEAGAEVRQGFAVDDLVWENNRVVGIRGHGPEGGSVVERAAITVGADGLHSLVAASIGAQSYEVIPPQTCGYFSHWADLPVDGIEIVLRPGLCILLFPSDDNLTCVAVMWKRSEFARVRANLEAEFAAALEYAPGIAQRVKAGRRAEPLRGTAELPMYLRVPYGPGAALVGDAACRVDPITGQGIRDAFRDAELLDEAIGSALGGGLAWAEALAEYQRRRDDGVMGIYRYTAQRARMEPPNLEMQGLVAALARNQRATDRFVGITAGTVRYEDFFSAEHMAEVMGEVDAAA